MTQPLRIVPKLSDDALVRLARDHDLRAGLELQRRYGVPMMRLASRIVGDGYASDCVQHAFIRALTTDKHYRQHGTFSSWLARVVRNKALDIYRSESLREQADEGEVERLADAKAESFIEAMLEEIDLSRPAVRELVARHLSPPHRKAAYLRKIEGYSWKEIYDEIRPPNNGSFKTEVSLGLKRITAEIEDLGY